MFKNTKSIVIESAGYYFFDERSFKYVFDITFTDVIITCDYCHYKLRGSLYLYNHIFCDLYCT